MMSCTYNHHLPLGGSLTHNSWSLLRPSINSRLGGTCFCKSRSCKLYWCGWWYIMVLQWFGWRLYWYSMVLVIVIWYTIPYMVYYTRYSDLLLHITPADSVDDIVWYSIWYMIYIYDIVWYSIWWKSGLFLLLLVAQPHLVEYGTIKVSFWCGVFSEVWYTLVQYCIA